MIEELQKNIDNEMEIAKEISKFMNLAENSSPNEAKVFNDVISSLRRRIKIINSSLPEIIKDISLTKKLPGNEKKEKLDKINLADKKNLFIKKQDKGNFLKELNISRNLLNKIKKKKTPEKEKINEYKKPNFYSKISNRFFQKVAESWIEKGSFKSLSLDLRRSNLNILTVSYISMMIFSIIISFFIGLGLFLFFLFFSLGIEYPFIFLYEGDYFQRILSTFWLMLAIPLLTGISFYYYPSAEKKSLAGRIEQELPFVVIHMGSISGSGIEPVEIFKIIGLNNDYKYTSTEIKKILNQTNIYGYDLTTALRNVALATPSPKLAELLNGISVTINSGGSISSFFEKRAESLLLEYRLEREKFTKNAETFMDIYISIVIAAPMILLMLLVMISVSGIRSGLTINQMTFGIIGIVAIINILFLVFLNLKQPSY